MRIPMPMLKIAPEVAELLGSEDAILKVFDTAASGYTCTECRRPGQLTTTATASVVAYLPHSGTGNLVVRLAHARCAESTVHITDIPEGADPGAIWPAKAWLRPEPDDPRAVVFIGPRLLAMRVSDGGETIDRLLSELLAYGFGLLTDPDAAMPDLEGLTVTLGPGGRVAVFDKADSPLWDGSLDLPPGWTEAAAASGRVGVVVASGLNLRDDTRDHLGEMFTAIGDGRAVAATAELLT
jgi:hypothetical protein